VTQPKIRLILVSDLGRIVTGNTPPRKIKDYIGNKTTWIKPTDIEIGSRFIKKTEEKLSDKGYEKYHSSLLPPLSTCVVTIGTVGEKICLTKEESFTNQAINAIIPDKSKFDPMFIFYLLKYNLHLVELRHSGTASGRQNISKSSFGNIKLKVTDLHSQKIIGWILSKYDDLIENNSKRIEILNKVAQFVYNEWFVNLKFPSYQKIKFVDSDYGMIPEGWKIKKLGDIVKMTRGLSYSSSNLVENGKIIFVTLKCIERGGGFRYDGIKRFEGKYKDSHVVKTGDIVIAVTDMTQERNIIARPARIPQLNENEIIISMDLVKVTPIEELDRNWLYSFLNYSTFGIEMKEFANGVNVLHLKSEPMEDFQFIMPDEVIIQKYSETVSKIYYQIDNLYLRNHNLANSRELLASKLLSYDTDISKLDIVPEGY